MGKRQFSQTGIEPVTDGFQLLLYSPPLYQLSYREFGDYWPESTIQQYTYDADNSILYTNSNQTYLTILLVDHTHHYFVLMSLF